MAALLKEIALGTGTSPRAMIAVKGSTDTADNSNINYVIKQT